MTTYVIGDIQGCYDALMIFLEKVKFNSKKDEIIFCGDLVNRGGQSLQVLRWVFENKQCCQVVLGNHDLSLLACYYLPKLRKRKNLEFKEIFKAEDCQVLMDWLKSQKLLIHLKRTNKVIVHAGIYPKWSLKRAQKEAKRVENKLKDKPTKFFKNMYGIKPNHWDKSNKGSKRSRFAVNCFTRMRFLYKNSGLNFNAKGETFNHPKLVPWFKFKKRKKIEPQIIFGHWSALGLYSDKNVICLDTGKVWGGKLTALILTAARIKSIKNSKHIVQS